VAVSLSLSKLNPKLKKIATNLPGVAKQLGFEAKVTSAFRTKAKQKKLYEDYKAGKSQFPAAPPGTSDHEIGMAIDVVSTNQDALVSLLTSAGLYWAGPSDTIHFSLLGPKTKIIVARGESSKYKVPARGTSEYNLITSGLWGGPYGIKAELKFFGVPQAIQNWLKPSRS
jgi:hypothetical protein